MTSSTGHAGVAPRGSKRSRRTATGCWTEVYRPHDGDPPALAVGPGATVGPGAAPGAAIPSRRLQKFGGLNVSLSLSVNGFLLIIHNAVDPPKDPDRERGRAAV